MTTNKTALTFLSQLAENKNLYMWVRLGMPVKIKNDKETIKFVSPFMLQHLDKGFIALCDKNLFGDKIGNPTEVAITLTKIEDVDFFYLK